jgi:hypothetical protein
VNDSFERHCATFVQLYESYRSGIGRGISTVWCQKWDCQVLMAIQSSNQKNSFVVFQFVVVPGGSILLFGADIF